ncbi:MAG: hypothetical protein RL030_2793 [Pseudomonadota bacterium]|jgi:hypothetical protein
MNEPTTHWSAWRHPDDWPDNPCPTLEEAAEQYIDNGFYSGQETIEVHGFRETTRTPEEEGLDDGFDGYEPGQSWFVSTGETKRLRLSLRVEVVS